MTTQTQSTIAHQGRWGFHPCSYEDFKKIKLLHKHFWIAKKIQAAFNRYHAKQPQNRVIRKQKGVPLTKPLPMPEPWFPSIYDKLLKKDVVGLYQQARKPHETADTVKMLPLFITVVDELLNNIVEAYSKK